MPSVSMAKNVMRRAMNEIIDPPPREADIAVMWKHFRDRCAYCDKPLVRSTRDWHRDHLDPYGSNRIANRVLACSICNGDEKRERDWVEFLGAKAGTDFAERKKRIDDWVTSHADVPGTESNVVRAKREEIERLIERFGIACAELREIV